jgi:hypothetical protein
MANGRRLLKVPVEGRFWDKKPVCGITDGWVDMGLM